MGKTVVAIFNSMDEAETAADDLFENGFLKEDIDVSSGEKYEEDEEGESGITRFFKNLFGTNDEKTKRYSRVAKKGYVVAVHTHSEEEALQACEILDDDGAIDVNDHYRKHVAPLYNDDDLENKAETEEEIEDRNEADIRSTDANDEATETIPVIEEDMEVHKKEVPTGGVRVRSRIIEKPVEENLRLREEHIHVERRKVNRTPTEEELKNFKNQTTEFTEHAEVPEIEKTPKVVEEVRLQKDVDHRNETVRDKVQRKDVDVENIDEMMKSEN